MLITDGPFIGLPWHHYRAVHIDPNWLYETYSEKGDGRGAVQHYKVATVDEIAKLPLPDILAKDATVFMWTIDTHLEHALALLKAWGLRYKTIGFYWAKTNKDGSFFTGLGHWTRANPETCWELEQPVERSFLATTGHPKRNAKDVRRLIVSPRREHSRKPDEIFERIERLVDGPYIDIFGRQSRPGWTVWGDEAGKFG